MTPLDKKLASHLLYLPIDVSEKIFLWLTYRGLKPVSEITVERRNLPLLRRLLRQGKKPKSTYDSNSPKTKRIRKWIRDAGMFYATEPKYESSWHISRDENKAVLSSKIIRKFDYKNEYLSGTLFGFPKESAKAYAHNRIAKFEKNQILMVWPGIQHINPYLKEKYFLPYIFYAIRADRVREDSKVAKLWADTIRKEIPTLARWYEKHVSRMNRK